MKLRQRKCRGCGRWYKPQPHNAYHQRHCTDERCQQARRRRNQARWRRHNRGYFSGPDQVERVRVWRARHPRHPTRPRTRTRFEIRVVCGSPGRRMSVVLQDLYRTQPLDTSQDEPRLNRLLQDLMGDLVRGWYFSRSR